MKINDTINSLELINKSTYKNNLNEYEYAVNLLRDKKYLHLNELVRFFLWFDEIEEIESVSNSEYDYEWLFISSFSSMFSK